MSHTQKTILRKLKHSMIDVPDIQYFNRMKNSLI